MSTLQYRSNLKSQGSWSLIKMQMTPTCKKWTAHCGEAEQIIKEERMEVCRKYHLCKGRGREFLGNPQWKRSISDGKPLPGPGGPSAEAAGQVSRRRDREGGLWLGILPECLGRLRGCVFYTGHHRGWGLCGSHSRTLCRGCKQKDGSWFQATFWKC